jgi:hypothetical protein
MSETEQYRIAKAYVDKKLKTMEKSGLRVKKITKHEYQSMVKQIAHAVRA